MEPTSTYVSVNLAGPRLLTTVRQLGLESSIGRASFTDYSKATWVRKFYPS